MEVVTGQSKGRPTKRWRRKSQRSERSERSESPYGNTQVFGTNGTFGPYDLSFPGSEEPPFPGDADRPGWLDEPEEGAL